MVQRDGLSQPPRDPADSGPLAHADLALARAVRAWGDDPPGPLSADRPHPFRRFVPARRAELEAARVALGRATPEESWQALLADQAASARFDPAHVHPSWFSRLFQAESPAVQWVIAQAAPLPIRDLLCARFADRLRALDPHDGLLRAVGAAHPAALALVAAYWTERLVGDHPASPHDPPVIVALTQLPPVALVRLLRAMGQAKQAFGLRSTGPTAADEERARCRPVDRVRVAYFRRTLGRVDPRLADAARRDFEAVEASPRRRYAAAGLVTVARLLREADPHRARWAVQHLPYPVARILGALGRISPSEIRMSRRAVLAWERWIVEAAWARLLKERRLAIGPAWEAGA